jgi:ribonuclease HI
VFPFLCPYLERVVAAGTHRHFSFYASVAGVLRSLGLRLSCPSSAPFVPGPFTDQYLPLDAARHRWASAPAQCQLSSVLSARVNSRSAAWRVSLHAARDELNCLSTQPADRAFTAPSASTFGQEMLRGQEIMAGVSASVLTVYTDGSYADGVAAGSWIVSEDDSAAGILASGAFKAPRLSSSYTAELLPVLFVLQGLPLHSDVTLKLDNMAVVELLSKGGPASSLSVRLLRQPDLDLVRAVVAAVKHRSGGVRVEHVRAHTGIELNEQADHLAKQARTSASPSAVQLSALSMRCIALACEWLPSSTGRERWIFTPCRRSMRFICRLSAILHSLTQRAALASQGLCLPAALLPQPGAVLSGAVQWSPDCLPSAAVLPHLPSGAARTVDVFAVLFCHRLLPTDRALFKRGQRSSECCVLCRARGITVVDNHEHIFGTPGCPFLAFCRYNTAVSVFLVAQRHLGDPMLAGAVSAALVQRPATVSLLWAWSTICRNVADLLPPGYPSLASRFAEPACVTAFCRDINLHLLNSLHQWWATRMALVELVDPRPTATLQRLSGRVQL